MLSTGLHFASESTGSVGGKRRGIDGRQKFPYDPRTGQQTASDDPSTWATQDEAH
jgi:hypothetical protein